MKHSAGTTSIEPAREPVSHLVRQPVSVSVFEATGSLLINPWLPGQRAGLTDEVVVSVLSASGFTTRAHSATRPYLSQMLGDRRLQPSRLPPPFLSCILFLRCCSAGPSRRHRPEHRRTSLSASPLFSPPFFPLHPSLSLSITQWDPSLHLSPPLPLFSPLPPCLAHCPFPLRSRERVPCVLPGSVPALIVFSPSTQFFFSFLPLIPRSPSFPHPLFSSLPPPSYLSLSPSTIVPITLSTCF